MKTKRFQFEKYEIISAIGHGGNATVYQAIQKNLDRMVALKVLLPALVNDLGYLERFHLEARSIAKLRHPNIVTIYDEGNEQGAHFIAMELLEGKDLQRLVKEKGPMQLQDALEMAKCIAGALDYAHGNGIIHRDVKSSNIIMSPARGPVLTDFGIAQSGVTSVHTKSGSVLGTPEFMSPEQAAGKTVDTRTDFYSLGVVLYHALSGHYPFQGDNPITTIEKILYEDPVPLGRLVKLPAALERAVEQCLVKDPDKRVRDGKELIELLNECTRETSARQSHAPVSIAAGQSVAEPSQGNAESPATRKVPQLVPEPVADPPEKAEGPATRKVPQFAPQRPAHPNRTGRTGRRATILRTVLLAIVACMMLTGYVTWQKGLKANVRTTHRETATVAPPELKLVPNLIGTTKEEAMTLLAREGFEVGSVLMVAVPNSEEKGKVDTQRPVRGIMALPGTTVDLLIGE
jgi:serine/threonine protein kinase